MTRTHLWDQKLGESAKAYEAFCVYRDLGSERSILKAAQKLLKSEGTLKRWAGRWNWTSRVDAWDTHISEQATKQAEKAAIEAKREMDKRQITVCSSMQNFMAIRVNTMNARLRKWQEAGSDAATCPLNELSDKDLIAYFKTGFDGERTIRGEATNIIRTETADAPPRRFTLLLASDEDTIPPDTAGDEPNEAQIKARSKD